MTNNLSIRMARDVGVARLAYSPPFSPVLLVNRGQKKRGLKWVTMMDGDADTFVFQKTTATAGIPIGSADLQ